ncbi:hem peroxidase [Rhypophila sp. PSN 637]
MANDTVRPEEDTEKDQDLVPSFKPGLGERIGIGAFHLINKLVPWYKLPGIIGAFNLAFLRVELRQYNLYDGYATAEAQGTEATEPMSDKRFLTVRNSDGKFNSLEMPRMGCAGMRFGRNFPRRLTPKPTEEELMTPNPRLVSNKFMARKEFIPATTLNLLAAAWIQFQTHDWFNHEESTEKVEIPLPKDDTWLNKHMSLHRTQPDETLDPSDIKCPGYKNANTAWWDGSQIYGSSEAATQSLRGKSPDGKLALDESSKLGTFLPRDDQGNPLTGFNNNWWIGMELLHTLFALEHNSICDALRKEYPDWSGDKIFDQARLINCALMAKIHTIEWTPAILAHPALQIGMSSNWWGIVGPTLTKAFGRLFNNSSDIISGIPGSGVNQDGVPFSLTEEFVSVYRMHSLMPDRIAFFSAAQDGKFLESIPLPSVAFGNASTALREGRFTMGDALYSFGINYPGAITNNNYPDFLRELKSPDGQVRDLGTVDILRDRERGVPRYCEFRRMLRMSVPKTFDELTGGNNDLARELEEVYDGKLEMVDALVGSHSEPVIPGFGFSETAFRVFILMASRRLKSDRFIAGRSQWGEDGYTKVGFRWVQDTGMKDILARHFPELKGVLGESKNVFAPWGMLAGSKEYDGVETKDPRNVKK